ncbi:MAG: TetR/AcrR family transcriptional regulator C-terminal domain-containing protein [Lachnospiraceae bacterium]|nr:TetR/AcrR family transcriptional regulator C-terminal domain-containing protein [Lachnospiraceae bacterium]
MANANITKKELAESLKRLASGRLFEHVTVGDIVKECGVNRQTFYYHFSDKYELLDWIYYHETFLPLTADISFGNWDEKLYELLRIMRENKAFYMNTIKCSDNFFEEYLLKMLTTLFETAVEDLDARRQLTPEKKQLASKIFAHGLTGVVIEWATGGMKEDEKLIAENMKELVDNIERLSYCIYQFKNDIITETETLSTLPIPPEILPKRAE